MAYRLNEERYRVLVQNNEPRAEELLKLANEDAGKHWKKLKQLAAS
ncbi:MAG: hypothetical protein NT121_12245 [Chloroflexi bacterium]|nr:hypothetical protein [Chloroflexota bacterium]